MEDKEKARERKRRYKKRHPEKIRKSKQKYYQDHIDHERERERNRSKSRILWKIQNPEAVKAENTARNLLTGDKCSQCGSTSNLIKHHPDYSKPLEVITLCRSCHKLLHNSTMNGVILCG